MLDTDTTKPVMVTGATGYVAGWLVKKLLDEGFTVHAAVRDPDNKSKVAHLLKATSEAPGELKFFKADLLSEGSYFEAMQGCQVVFHTASPFTSKIKDPQKDLVEPAQLGTRNVLESVNKTPSVKRVVLTSSCAAIYGDNADRDLTPNGIFTEDLWNNSSSLKHQPYSYSKTLAEKEAWKINEAQNQWELVVVNPSLVIGPGLNPNATSESFSLIKQLGDGSMKSGVPQMGIGVVDVRDLAEAHFNAAFCKKAKGRYIISAHSTDLKELAETLLPKYGQNYPIPRKTLPKFLVWLLGPILDKNLTRRMVIKNVNIPWKADNSKGIQELNLSYRPLENSMNDFFQQMIDNKFFESKTESM